MKFSGVITEVMSMKKDRVITNDQRKVHAKGQGHRGHNPT